MQQGLKNTANFSWVAGAATALTPGGQGATIVFAGIGTLATVAERVLYPEDPLDPTIDLIKAATPMPGGPFADQAKDIMIDIVYDAIKRDEDECRDENNVQDQNE